jgi:L-rhamnose mutarotase
VEKIAFRMQLKPGCIGEYRRRHDEIWPDLADALRAAGIRDYSIHHDPITDALFATLWRNRDHGMGGLAALPVMRRWWAWMAPLMETGPDDAPLTWPLDTVFHLDPQ